MNYDDQCFYIAISSEEDTAFKKYQEPKKKNRLNSMRLRNQSFITASSVALELHSEGLSSTDGYGEGIDQYNHHYDTYILFGRLNSHIVT